MKFKNIITFLTILQITLQIPIYGNTSLGYYYIKGFFGISKAEQTLIFDTGSDQLIIDCDTCTDCGTHTHDSYKINESVTKQSPTGFEGFECSSDKCGFGVSYAEGSSYSGSLFKELFSLESTGGEIKENLDHLGNISNVENLQNVTNQGNSNESAENLENGNDQENSNKNTENVQKNTQENVQNNTEEKFQNNTQENVQNNTQENVQNNTQENVQNNTQENVQNNTQENVQKNTQEKPDTNPEKKQEIQITKSLSESFYIIMGCAESETGLFRTQKADGIIGMSPKKNKPNNTNIINLMKKQGLIENNIFSICLGLDGGQFNIENWNSNFHEENEEKKILDLKNYDWSDFIKIPIDSLFVDDLIVLFDFSVYKFDSFSHAFLDTGTTMTYFPVNLFSEIEKNFEAFCGKNSENCDSHDTMENCYNNSNSSKSEILKSFPILKFKIENNMFEWLPKNYLIFTESEFCLGFEKESNQNSNTITLGGTFMRNYDFFIDFQKNSLGFVKSNCSPSVKHFSHKMFKNNFYNKNINKKIFEFRKRKIAFHNYHSFLFLFIFAIVVLIGVIRVLYHKSNREDIFLNDEFVPLELFE